ncbi:MAG TPA: AAA family ATPase [Solirubrobacterales bacterium]|nr:AAA family ATPase [Solirubrobacterales bacterium]
MGFLSRKNKSAPAPVQVEEPHPIVEELEAMEEAVPARRDDKGPVTQPAGPAAEVGVSESALGFSPDEDVALAESSGRKTGRRAASDTPSSAAPAGVAVEDGAPPAPAEAEQAVKDGPERFMPKDLLAPSRHEAVVEEPVEETPTKHAEVIAFANQKGGVAKTTTTLNLAVAFAESGHRVLCIDLDPQGNLTMSQGIDPDKVEKSLYDVLVHDMPISEIIQHREIDIAVSSIDLAGAEIAMSTKIGRERSLEKALKEVAGDYDFVCIDTPPSLGLLTINALTAANKVIVPVQCEYLSMRGLVQLQNTLKMIQENLNPDVRIEGILPTMLDTRTVHAKEAVEILEENFGDLVFHSRIRKAIKFAEAPVKGASVLKYDPQGNAAGYYRDLAKEVLANESA